MAKPGRKANYVRPPKQYTTAERLGQFVTAREKVMLKGLDPIDMLYEVYFIARDRGLAAADESAGSFLSVAGKAAADLAKYIYPTMAAIKMETVNKSENAMSVKEAIKVVMADPFTKSALTAMAFREAKEEQESEHGESEAVRQIINALPSGEANEGEGEAAIRYKGKP